MIGLIVAAAMGVRADELDEQIKVLSPQLEDRKLAIAERERLALEIATNLDNAAQAATTAEARRARWVEAAALLDRFGEHNPGHPQRGAFALQSAVYRWAESQGWIALAEVEPGEEEHKRHAVEALDAAIARLKPIADGLSPAKKEEAFGQAVRYRLARSLADRANLAEDGAKAARERALALLVAPIAEPSLKGFAHLLRAELLTKLGAFGRAEEEWNASGKADPAPTPLERLDARVNLAVARQRFDEAMKVVEGDAKVDEDARERLAFRVGLARYEDLPKGPARSVAEADLFRRAETLRRKGRPEARADLAALAKAVVEPGPGLGPDSWDALAEGQLALGHAGCAGALAATAAEKAQALGHFERANALRYRAAALDIQAEAFGPADTLLTRLIDDPKAGPLRPKAGLLRILARAKLLEQSRGGDAAPYDAAPYLEALEAQIRDFPKDTGADEARWRLGRALLASGDRDRAIALWSAIPHGSPHWLAARFLTLDLLEGDFEAPRLNEEMSESRRLMDVAQRFLDKVSIEVDDGPERADLDLSRALLDLTPDVGRPEAALAACDRLARVVGRDDLRVRARQLRIVALAMLGRSVDAERDARVESAQARPDELLELARRLDRAASSTESDLARRRLGGIVRILLARLNVRPADLTPPRRAEVAIRMARARVFGGDLDGARKGLADAAIDPKGLDDRLLADLADAYAELEVPAPAAEAYRLLARRRKSGSIPWLAARYGQALADSKAGRPKEARQLIDGTAILHPELGAGAIRNKFERLRQRLARE